MSGPLTGIKVIELAGIGPGPMCAMLLSSLGEPHWVLWRLELLVSNQCVVGPSGRVGGFELCGRGVVEVAVESLVVVPVHPAQGGQFDGLPRVVRGGDTSSAR